MAIRERDLKSSLKFGKLYTHEEYMNLDYGDGIPRLELIDGEIYFMAAPNREHQEIAGNLHGTIWNFLKGKKCQVFAAPFAVNLGKGKGHDTTVQPDLVVVCDPNKLDKKGCNGAPDIVIEILSPSTAKLDVGIKQKKYQDAGVLEYWIISPDMRTVQQYTLKDGLYFANSYTGEYVVTSNVLEGLEIPWSDIFPPEEIEQTEDEINQQEEI